MLNQTLAAIERIELEKRIERLREALNRIVGMVDTYVDQYGHKRTEEIYASNIARVALKADDEAKDFKPEKGEV